MDVRDFWIEPSPERTISFFLALLFLGLIVIGVQISYRHRIKARWESEFVRRLKEAGILGKPEELVLRDLTERYKITPPAQVLSSLNQYDDFASQEIHRLERAVMPLGERIDRIEYLYSIRIQAFNDDPAITGAKSCFPGNPKSQFPAPRQPALSSPSSWLLPLVRIYPLCLRIHQEFFPLPPATKITLPDHFTEERFWVPAIRNSCLKKQARRATLILDCHFSFCRGFYHA
ncbi:MAG: hypothetical protein UZ16_OP3001001664 [Candidatus Hinthialibacteria bacterium OLB16]|nr:MAG: hypothetical protein UZ16_OP3001001664 [Candidatus Hinthialibacteria bacterium OLB16]